MYVGVVKTPGSTHYGHEWFSMQGIFSIKTIPLGANKVLMEEMEEGIIQDLITDANEWIYEKFSDIRKWSEAEGDDERVVWNNEFFERLAGKFGVLLGVDEDTRKKTSMEVARLRIRTKSYDVFNMVVEAYINNFRCDIKVVEEWCGPLYWINQPRAKEGEEESLASDEDSEFEEDDGPPLFTVDDDGYGSPVEGEEDGRSPEIKNVESHEEQPITHGIDADLENEKRHILKSSNDEKVDEEVEHGERGKIKSQIPSGGEENVGGGNRKGQEVGGNELSQSGENMESGGVQKGIIVVDEASGCNSNSGGYENEVCIHETEGCENQSSLVKVKKKNKKKAHEKKGKKSKNKAEGGCKVVEEGVETTQRPSNELNPTRFQKQNEGSSSPSINLNLKHKCKWSVSNP